MEKLIIRDAFDETWLPREILYRRKHAFSDAIDGPKTCFYKEVEKYADSVISDKEWNNRYEKYPVNTPVSKESYFYRTIFEREFGDNQQLISHTRINYHHSISKGYPLTEKLLS